MEKNHKFKADPYNVSNKLIQSSDIINIMKNLNINDLKINNLQLYQTAFIHKSYCDMIDYSDFTNDKNFLPLQKESYETMEFLGDSILSSVITNYLYKRFKCIHGENEGFLTKLRTRIVCGEHLSKLSKMMKFNEFIVISKHIEENCDGRNNEHILEDIFEAFLGAIFLDNDYNFTEKILIQLIEELVDFTNLIINDNNYKDQILKYFQHNFKKHPKYEHTRKDETNNIFYCNLIFEDKIICEGHGNTKKRAEQDVSKNALKYYNVLT